MRGLLGAQREVYNGEWRVKTKDRSRWKKRASRQVGLSKEREFVGVGNNYLSWLTMAPNACTAVMPQSCEHDAEMPPTTPKSPAILMPEHTIATPSHWPEPLVADLRRYFDPPLAVEFGGSFGGNVSNRPLLVGHIRGKPEARLTIKGI